MIREASKYLKDKLIKELNALEMNDYQKMRQHIAQALFYGKNLIKNTSENPLMLMEKERVQSTKIREMLNNSEIKYINCFVPLKEVITEEMINQMMKYYEIDEKDKIVDQKMIQSAFMLKDYVESNSNKQTSNMYS